MEYKMTLEGPGFKSVCKLVFTNAPEGFNPREHASHPRLVRVIADRLVRLESQQCENTIWNKDRKLYEAVFLIGDLEFAGVEAETTPAVEKEYKEKPCTSR